MFRSLTHYWRIHLAVILGAAVTTSVLTGALLVGDSIRGSLRQLTLGRLGSVTHAVVSTRPVRERLAEDLLQEGMSSVAPALQMTVTLRSVDSGKRANGVTLYGVDDRFGAFFLAPETDGGTRLRSIHVSEAVSRALGAGEGEALVLSVASHTDIHREFLFGRDDAGERLIRRRVRLAWVVSSEQGGRFSLEPNQSIPLVAYAPLAAVQRLMGLEGRINTILLKDDQTQSVIDALTAAVELADYGLVLRDVGQMVSLESTQFLLSKQVIDVAREIADVRGMATVGILTYLANTISIGESSIPYSTVAAIGPLSRRSPPEQFVTASGEVLGFPLPGQMLINQHANERLNPAGERVTARFFEVESDESFTERDTTFSLSDVLAIQGLAADPTLTPNFPGLHEADNMVDWDAPFPVDFSRIGERDEEYWDEYRATPKAFISLEDGRALWASRFGELTAVRFHIPDGVDRRFIKLGIRSAFRQKLSPESQGIRVLPLRDQGLAASQGATDFSGLFIGFSMFLIASAIVMISQLVKLGIIDRVREIGLLKAVGFETGRVRSRWITEGVILACIAVAIGVVGGVGYARMMVHGLTTWWVEAVGTRLLDYHGSSLSIAIGGVASLVIILIVIWRAVGMAARQPAVHLIKSANTESQGYGVAKARRVGQICAIAFAVFLVLPMLTDVGAAAMFFAAGASALGSMLGSLKWLATEKAGSGSLALAQVVRFPGRAIASVSLVSTAVFVLVAVGMNRHEGADGTGIPVGAGGFRWVGETVSPVLDDLSDSETLTDLGFPSETVDRLSGLDVVPFRLRPGEDVSCLNLHRPGQPRILGVGNKMIDRGGFRFQSLMEGVDADNPWQALTMDLGEGVVPAIGDFNSVMWILHSGLGQDLVMQDESGETIRLRFVALLQGSILQSEIMISEARFTSHFPSIAGHSFFLIGDHGADDIEVGLESGLDACGMDVTSTAFRLARYRAVENTYMTTFQAIGGLGAVLGTLGIGVLMLRNAAERRGELAGMRAIGFSRSRLQGLLFRETALLVVTGAAVGTVAGLIAVAPVVMERAGAIPWPDVALSVASVCVVGCIAGYATAYAAMRAPIVETLKVDV